MLADPSAWMPDALWESGGKPLRRLPDGGSVPPITTAARDEAIEHARTEWPNESCGILILRDGVQAYLRAANVHPTPRTHFLIPRDDLARAAMQGTIIGVLHSHPDASHLTGEGLCPSEADFTTQLDWRVPFYITAMSPRGTFMDFFGWGDELPTPPLRRREFRHSMTDCYALVRHLYHHATGVVLQDFPRKLSWWADPKGFNPLVAGMESSGWVPVDMTDLQAGDGLLFSLKGGVIQHCGLYLGKDLFAHHLHGRLSSVDPLPQWRRFLRKTVRFAPGAQ